ncbi:hypothetical protein [Roseomonas xinghualingensis]|uniref:hypothetical protein n=1 Tax=Roseomonas xinghualingensis TaxID=2986475 RepID=UPI0021F14DC0|nr:hypothetical protein [Roseomonas sp. SXEYE001]MCV4208589.1 hypothetical protein [Roseomonas sp. SXEYE001]
MPPTPTPPLPPELAAAERAGKIQTQWNDMSQTWLWWTKAPPQPRARQGGESDG